jgi:CheY-like chemotaxis protein
MSADRDPSGGAIGRVLLAEDNLVNQRIARRVLERAGYKVDVVGDGEEAVEAARTGRYDLVLMDCQMPGVDGLEAARRIRKLEGPARDVAIVALTANEGADDPARCRQAGMDAFLVKPFDPTRLLELVRLAIGRALPERGSHEVPPSGTAVERSALDVLERVARLGKEGAIEAILDLYLRDAPIRVERIRKAALEGALLEASQTAHSLKSSSATLGARRLAWLCGELEHLAAEEAALAQALAESIVEEWPRVRTEIETARARIASSG